MLVARTNWDVPKHRGLSYFIIDVHQPGIEIRPLRQMNGAAHFNEVFFDEARVPHANLIGGEGDGWAAAVSTLAFERSGLSSRVAGLTSATPGERGGMLDRPAGEAAASSGRNGPGPARRPRPGRSSGCRPGPCGGWPPAAAPPPTRSAASSSAGSRR